MIERNVCNRCGYYRITSDQNCWPTASGSYYGRLCEPCRLLLNDLHEWERQRLELVHQHSE